MTVVSETVWVEQVDIALIDYISNIVKLSNKYGELVSVPVKVRKEDSDFKVEEYPCITLYNLYSIRDQFRYHPDRVVVERDESGRKLVEESGAIPYSLYYQIDFWSRQQSDMNDMTRLWIGHNADRDFNLPVKDMSGKDRSCYVLLVDDLKKSDFLTESRRTFRSMMTYRIWVEIDERVRIEGDMITEVPYPITKRI